MQTRNRSLRFCTALAVREGKLYLYLLTATCLYGQRSLSNSLQYRTALALCRIVTERYRTDRIRTMLRKVRGYPV